MKTVIIAGAGCNNVGWGPVKQAIGLADPIFYFSFLSNQLRTGKMLSQFDNLPDELKTTTLKDLDKNLNTRKLLLFKIAESIKKATSGCSLNKIPDKKTEEIIYDPDTLWITMNWDKIIENKINPHKIIHVHGDIDDPETMLLPTEAVVFDQWIFSDSYKTLYRRWYQSIQGLKSAQRIIFWGCSLAHYDAELYAIISMAKDKQHALKTLEEIVLIDLNEQAPTLINKIKFLFDKEPRFLNADKRTRPICSLHSRKVQLIQTFKNIFPSTLQAIKQHFQKRKHRYHKDGPM